MRYGAAAVAALIAVATTVPARAEIPQLISYQGRVTDGSGVPVADGTYDMRFRIYDAETGGTMEWDSGTRSVQAEAGVFSVLLGESPQPTLNLPFDEDYWLLVTFDGVNQTPRQRFASTCYAYMASGLVPGTEVEGSPTGAVLKATNTRTSGNSYGLRGNAYSTSGRGVYGRASASTGTTSGLYGVSISTDGRGVYGEASANSGFTFGGRFKSSSPSGTGVYGENPASTGATCGGYFKSASDLGTGVYGKASATDGEGWGGWFDTASNAGRGVYGRATSSSGQTYGVYGASSSTTYGRGVYGLASGSGGETCGGRFVAHSPDGTGVHAEATATTGTNYGLYAVSHSTSGRAIYAEATATTGFPCGVFAESPHYGVEAVSSGALGSGVYASAGGAGVEASGAWGVYASGTNCGGYFRDVDTWVEGAVGNDTYSFIGNGSKSFVQNHPERRDRVIAYAALEGDEVGTYTRGTARLVEGEAVVPLGETFKWVTNPDIGLTVHLTPRTDCGGLYVASLDTREITVRELGGGTSDASFDYLVIGLRVGFEEQSIVQEKEIEAYIPSMASHRERYGTYPDLRQYNAMERFKAMRAVSGNKEPLDLGASEALRDAIEEYDPGVHGTVESPIQRARKARQEAGATASPMPRRHRESREEEAMSEKELAQTGSERTEMTGSPTEGKEEAWSRGLRGAVNLDGGGENR
jgi:hypothetical protein